MTGTLRNRLSIGLSVSLVLFFTVLGTVVVLTEQTQLEDYIESRLIHDSRSLLGSLEFDPQGEPRLHAEQGGGVYRQPHSGYYYTVRTRGRVLASRSLWDASLPSAPLAVGEQRLVHAPGPDGKPLLVHMAGYRKQGETVRIAVAEALTPLQDRQSALQWRYGALFLLGLVLAITVQRLLVSRSLRPLDATQIEVRRLERGQLEQLTEQGPREVLPLIREINRLLQRQAERLRRSRENLSNLAHALKTPLARLRQLSEGPELEGHPELRHGLNAAIDTLQQRVDHQLQRARLVGSGGSGRVRPAQVLPELVQALSRLYPENGPAIHLAVEDDAEFPMDPEDFMELAGNLLDNACKWAQGRIEVTVRTDALCSLTVEDNGPGCPPEAYGQLGERGTRLDETTPGDGLGLAIVRDLLATYHGHLTLDGSVALGGFRAEASVPAETEPS